ncbi:hypothetical protein F503_04304 [Ophiostoma piceae UAMH 11346]|uniref:Uncharacterized protein n=1 Tax=Ophiostoma piceae (strain UAMH 11346) TaxID=1262450 RepID=S3C7F0_OPHP1|nr:hypothetical protein F503_04304 [Ophiostoma piceae UAMH 11346]
MDQALEGAEVLFELILAGARAITADIAKRRNVWLTIFNTGMPVPDASQGICAQDVCRTIRDNFRPYGLQVTSIQSVCYLKNLLGG